MGVENSMENTGNKMSSWSYSLLLTRADRFWKRHLLYEIKYVAIGIGKNILMLICVILFGKYLGARG